MLGGRWRRETSGSGGVRFDSGHVDLLAATFGFLTWREAMLNTFPEALTMASRTVFLRPWR
jgi:hypothetical protein